MRIRMGAHAGPLYAEFERIGMAFNVYGFDAPTPDQGNNTNGTGAYVVNIVNQYTANGSLTEEQALAIIWHGVNHSKAQLEQEREFHLFVTPLDQLVANYLQQAGEQNETSKS